LEKSDASQPLSCTSPLTLSPRSAPTTHISIVYMSHLRSRSLPCHLHLVCLLLCRNCVLLRLISACCVVVLARGVPILEDKIPLSC